jgi:hypothetical protein
MIRVFHGRRVYLPISTIPLLFMVDLLQHASTYLAKPL